LTELDRILYRVARPARYTGNEWNSVSKDWAATPLRIVLCYPDSYEIGMSALAIPILYEILNRRPDTLAERVFTPEPDMSAALAENGIPLYSLESRHPLSKFDAVGFSLEYELTYTNVLQILHLAQIPLLAGERNEAYPLIIAGGSCALNPEPMADFIDAFIIGDGEEAISDLADILKDAKTVGAGRTETLKRLAQVPGVYIPRFYRDEYGDDGNFRRLVPLNEEAPPIINRHLVEKLPPPPTRPVVPYVESVHDRGAIEIQRGCSRGCRFCQAGSIYRPVRQRPPEEIINAAGEIIANCGYNELSLVSLSSSDYPEIDKLVEELFFRYQDRNLILSLPSLRLESFSVRLLDSLAAHKRTGLTFAPEAGSERLRRAINKNIPEATILETAAEAFARGWTGIKLYFMLGLPTETDDDITALIALVEKIRAVGRQQKRRRPQIRVSLSTFVPKPHTPFQWVPQESAERLEARCEMVRQGLRYKDIKLSWNNPQVSQLEAAMSRGDRRLGRVIRRAWELGSTHDGWSERFKHENWLQAFAENNLDPDFYARRERNPDAPLPWGHIDAGVTTEFLKRELTKSLKNEATPDCHESECSACGIQRWYPTCPQGRGRL